MAKGEAKESVTIGFTLPLKKVIVKPIPRGSSMIQDPDHVGYFMYPETEASYILPRSLANGNWIQCLTKEEQMFLEEELKVDLSFRKDNFFWSNRRVSIKRTDRLLAEGEPLDISTPDGYLDYKILLAQAAICGSWNKRNDKAEYKFAIIEEDEIQDQEISEAELKEECFEHYVKIKASKKKLYDFLVMFGKKPHKDSALEFLKAEVYKVLDEKPISYKKIIDDKNYETKVFINDALTAGGLKLAHGTKSTYTLGYGSEDVIGRTLDDTINFLKDKKNSSFVLEIQARIENAEKVS